MWWGGRSGHESRKSEESALTRWRWSRHQRLTTRDAVQTRTRWWSSRVRETVRFDGKWPSPKYLQNPFLHQSYNPRIRRKKKKWKKKWKRKRFRRFTKDDLLRQYNSVLWLTWRGRPLPLGWREKIRISTLWSEKDTEWMLVVFGPVIVKKGLH